MILSILIPTIRRHDRLLTSLIAELRSQMLPYAPGIEILIDDDETASIGTKRNRLIQRVYGKYLAFFDSDDMPSPNYIRLLMEAVETNPDCASLKGMYSVNGVFDGIFEHSIKYNEWRTVNGEIKYERYPNHLNMIRTDIAKKFKFPETNFGEDRDWSAQIHKSGLLKEQYYISEIIYYYRKIIP